MPSSVASTCLIAGLVFAAVSLTTGAVILALVAVAWELALLAMAGIR